MEIKIDADAAGESSHGRSRLTLPFLTPKIKDVSAFDNVRIHRATQSTIAPTTATSFSLKNLERTAFRSSQGLLERITGRSQQQKPPSSWPALLLAFLSTIIKWLWVDDADKLALKASDTHLPRLLTATTPDAKPLQFPWNALHAIDLKRKRFGVSRAGVLMLSLMLYLGISELTKQPQAAIFLTSETSLAHLVSTHNPVQLLKEIGQWKETSNSGLPSLPTLLPQQADVTAILLNWKRLPNVVVLLTHLCQFSFIRSIVVNNNNPDSFIVMDDFKDSQCPRHKIHIFNSPTNAFFLPRHVHCASASTESCLYLDDDYLFYGVEALYSLYKSDHGRTLTASADPQMSSLFNLEWCFLNNKINLHTCFAWLGYGSFVSRKSAREFLLQVADLNQTFPSDQYALADNYFATFTNEFPLIVESPLTSLSLKEGFSDGSAGLERNKDHITRGLHRLVDGLALNKKQSRAVPYTRSNIKAVSAGGDCLLISNVDTLPFPTNSTFPATKMPNLKEWEAQLGFVGSHQSGGVVTSTALPLHQQLERFSIDYPFSAAVDGKHNTVWRTPGFVLSGQYVGLRLLTAWPSKRNQLTKLIITFEDEHEMTANLDVQVSLADEDDHWRRPELLSQWSCKTSQHALKHVDRPFAKHISRLSKARHGQEWLRQHGRVAECHVLLSTRLGDRGWQQVRLIARADLQTEFNVYEMGLGALH